MQKLGCGKPLGARRRHWHPFRTPFGFRVEVETTSAKFRHEAEPPPIDRRLRGVAQGLASLLAVAVCVWEKKGSG